MSENFGTVFGNSGNLRNVTKCAFCVTTRNSRKIWGSKRFFRFLNSYKHVNFRLILDEKCPEKCPSGNSGGTKCAFWDIFGNFGDFGGQKVYISIFPLWKMVYAKRNSVHFGQKSAQKFPEMSQKCPKMSKNVGNFTKMCTFFLRKHTRKLTGV
jgi:hypothetical protein